MLKKNRSAETGDTPSSPLDGVPLLASLTPKQRADLAHQMTTRVLGPGERAVLEGRNGVGFFMITSGTATVEIGGETRRTLGPGDYFGEVAMLSDDGVRSATVVATTELHCLAMSAWQFKPFLANHPDIAWEIMSTMAKRLAGD
jgi:CRP-like cAMP-binding protein